MATKKTVAPTGSNPGNERAKESQAKSLQGPASTSKIAHLSASSNSSLGVDAEVAAGRARAVSHLKTSKEMNSGASVGKASVAETYGKGDFLTGTQGAREDMHYGPPANRGQFAKSAYGGSRNEGSTGTTLGSGSRAKGTAAGDSGTPGRTGSMARAHAGLTGGSGKSFGSQAPRAAAKSIVAANKGTKGRGTGNE